MPNPLIFLIVVVVIDLVLKSMRDKKKMEKTRRQNMEQRKHTPTSNTEKTFSDRPIRELRKILNDELENERSRKQEEGKTKKNIDTMEKRKSRDDLIETQRKKVTKHSELEKMRRRKETIEKDRQNSRDRYDAPVKKALVTKTEKDKSEFRQDILKGIIFSEILGKPKSLRK